jgi:CheY-like chemotaxis protein
MTEPHFHALLIEDNPDHATLISDVLWKVREIKNITIIDDGQKALDFISKARKIKNFPDLILLDINLPMLNGFELLKIWKSDSITKKLPIVILSTSDMDKDKQKAKLLGAKNYLVKPSDFSTLYLQIKNIIQKSSQKNTSD